MSFVPLVDLGAAHRAVDALHAVVRDVAVAAEGLDRVRAHALAISEAKSFAIDASLRHGSPALRNAAACSTSCRAASMAVAMSARRNATAWCSMIGLPKVIRSFAYASASSIAARAMPMHWDAMPMRPPSRFESAIR